MKKNLIYTVTFLLCGAIFFSSCEDMLNVESNRVEYEFEDWTLNDSVYSVLGILKCVQEVGDRQILLNELRADLISLNESKAVVDVQELSRSEFNVETNKYLDVKDYYAIINNCNIYLARVDTTLEKNNIRLMLPEYVAVKSVRAWTYLQLAINYNYVPYFTKPILTHSAADEVMRQPALSRNEIITKLIDDILPYENPAAYTMPAWDTDGKILKIGYKNTEVFTEKLFVPVRVLLADMYLWRGQAGDYKKAAQCYYDVIVGARTNGKARKYHDHQYISAYSQEGGKFPGIGFAMNFAYNNFDELCKRSILALIPFANTTLEGTISQLSDVFLPVDDIGGSQVVASPAMISLSERQVYRYAEGEDLDKPTKYEYSNEKNYKTKGDLRLISTTSFQVSDDEQKNEYNNLISKFNLETASSVNGKHEPNIPVSYIVISRVEQLYLRFAEALMGMEREGYDGAMELAMDVLKVGLKDTHTLYQNPIIAERPMLNSKGDTIWNYVTDPDTKEVVDSTFKVEKYIAEYSDSITYDFKDADNTFVDNKGIHSRGSGDSEHNAYYALDAINVARYMGKTLVQEDKTEVLDPQNPVTYEDSVLYVSELILDEMALELAWEGYRFGDLVRVSKALNDNDVLAKRVAARDIKNTVSHRHPAFNFKEEIRAKMSDESNWYLPLPDEIVIPGKVEDTPTESEPVEPAEPTVPEE